MGKIMDVVQLVDCLSNMQKGLGFIPHHCLTLDVVVYPLIPVFGRDSLEDQEFKIILGYMVNMRSVWAT